MTLDQARALRDALTAAIEKAEANGETGIDALEALLVQDDVARADLVAAIERAGGAS